ncbi:MAG: hypothetical protein LBE35_05725 [Clostridiales bacterium]|jgi:hypothetical protein|nr:hypothetical protein [Clostridiales bacterium]
MRNWVFLKSALRRPVLGLLLVALLGVAAFAFSLRVTEYVILSQEIARIEGYYRSIGFLRNNLDAWGEVNAGAEILRDSPFVAWHDGQRRFMGVMDGVKTPFSSATAWAGDGIFIGDAYFYGEIISMDYLTISGAMANLPDRDFFQIRIRPDYILAGFDEHVSLERSVSLLLPLQDGVLFHSSHGTPFNPDP